MKLNFWVVLILGLAKFQQGSTLQVPMLSETTSQILENRPLISERTEQYIKTLLKNWNSSGLSVAVVRKDPGSPTGWRHEFGAYGIAQADGSPVTPDSVFAIGSNSKLFLAISVGLLVSNRTLAEERGKEIKWSTKIQDLIPEWGLMDEEMDRGVTLQDMLSHRTGMPRHDFFFSSGVVGKGGVSERISNLRYLKPSAEFREIFQYNNLMYETLSYLPEILLNQTYESYAAQHIFNPLNMTASTYSVAEAEARGTLTNGFQWDMRDITKGKKGTLVPTVPYFQPVEERSLAGAGGVLSSARDLAVWMSMLLNSGRHPYTNKVIVPSEVIEHVAYGSSVMFGRPGYPELSPIVYGAGQMRSSYQGHDLIEHGGALLGYKTQVARFPDDNLGIIVLSNDERGDMITEPVKFRIADGLLGLKELDWSVRYEAAWNRSVENAQQLTPRPAPPLLKSPSAPFTSLAGKTFNHPAYGTLQPCLVSSTLNVLASHETHAHADCPSILSSYPVRRILSASDLSIPTYIFKRSMSTYLRLAHFDENLFNVTLLWSNAEVREQEGYDSREGESKGDVMIGFDIHFEVEWVHATEGNEEEGLAFKGGFWGAGFGSLPPGGVGKESAEVWFARV